MKNSLDIPLAPAALQFTYCLVLQKLQAGKENALTELQKN